MFEGVFQPMHLLFILVIALIFFGPRRLPELGAGLGKGIREFKKAMAEGGKEFNSALSDEEQKATGVPHQAASEKVQKEGPAKSA